MPQGGPNFTSSASPASTIIPQNGNGTPGTRGGCAGALSLEEASEVDWVSVPSEPSELWK